MFLLALFGVPRLIRELTESAWLQQEAATGSSAHRLPPLDPSAPTFARKVYPVTPSNANELALKENEIVAITGKLDRRKGAEVDSRMEVEGEWWKGRTREGHEGWFPKKMSRGAGEAQAGGAEENQLVPTPPMYTRILVPW